MRFSPLLVLHICSGTIGCLSGFVAVFLRKGSRRHGLAGRVFVVSMLVLGATGAWLALGKVQPGNILGGTLTCYLVATAWITVRKTPTASPGIFDWCALLIAAAVTAIEITLAIQALNSPNGQRYGYSAGPYLMLGTVGLLAVTGDVHMLVRGGISGTARIARHLWRMCFAFFVAAGSIFLARQHLFPVFMRRTGMLFVLSFMPLILMVFWLIRVRLAPRFSRAGPGTRKPVPVSVRA